MAFSDFYDGDYISALKRFENEGRACIKTAQSRWIDSICYETMVGECYYEMGHLEQALDHYTAAIKLYLAFSDWMSRVQFTAIRPSSGGIRHGRPLGRQHPPGASGILSTANAPRPGADRHHPNASTRGHYSMRQSLPCRGAGDCPRH